MIRKNIRPASIRQQPNIRHWKNVLQGEPAFLLGNGCSVADDDVQLVRDYMTIGINRAFYLLDPVVLFWQDASLWETEREGVTRSTALKVCRDISDPQRHFHHFRLRSTESFRLADTPSILYGAGATGPLAVQFAHALGCDPIVLIGFDCKYREAKTDFYGVNRHHKPHTLPNCLKGLHWIKGCETSRRIINASDNDVYGERHRLADILSTLPPPKGRDHYIRTLQTVLQYS